MVFHKIEVYSQLEYQKRMIYIQKTTKDIFGFLFILHYYSYNGLLYVNKLNDVLLN